MKKKLADRSEDISEEISEEKCVGHLDLFSLLFSGHARGLIYILCVQ